MVGFVALRRLFLPAAVVHSFKAKIVEYRPWVRFCDFSQIVRVSFQFVFSLLRGSGIDMELKKVGIRMNWFFERVLVCGRVLVLEATLNGPSNHHPH